MNNIRTLERSDLTRETIQSEKCGICDANVRRLTPFEGETAVVSCTNCGTQSLRPLPTDAQLREHYRDYVITKTEDRQLFELISLGGQTLEYYLSKTALTERRRNEIRFLEIGFGNGAGLFAASKLGLRAFGIDLDPVCVSNAKEFAQQHGFNVMCFEGTVSELKALRERYDLVKASQLLEHVINPLRFLNEISSVQSAGGYLIIECPNNRAAFWRIKNLLRRKFGRTDHYNSLKLMEHLWGYTKKSLGLLLDSAGYDIVFLTDYAMGDAIFEPQSTLWYPKLLDGLKSSIRMRWWQPLGYAGVRQFDWLSSRLLKRGTGLAVLCRKR